MLARAAGVTRHHALRMMARTVARMVVVLFVAAYPFWANPARVNADPTPWDPKIALEFDSQRTFDKVCRASGDARLADSMLVVGASSGIDCPGSEQKYGRYEFLAIAPAGATSTFALTGSDGPPYELQLLTRNGVEVVRLVNGDDVRDWPFTFSDRIHRYRIEWAPSGLAVFVEDCPRLRDARVSPAPRTLAISLSGGGDVALRVKALLVFSYIGGANPSPPPDACQSPAPTTVRHRGLTWWWVGGAAGAAVAVAAVVIAIRRRDPRKLRPGHRK
jgi:hypothetical protein